MNEHTRSLARAIGLSVARRYPVTRRGAMETAIMDQDYLGTPATMSVHDARDTLGLDRRFASMCERVYGRGADTVDLNDPEVAQAAIACATPDGIDVTRPDGTRYCVKD